MAFVVGAPPFPPHLVRASARACVSAARVWRASTRSRVRAPDPSVRGPTHARAASRALFRSANADGRDRVRAIARARALRPGGASPPLARVRAAPRGGALGACAWLSSAHKPNSAMLDKANGSSSSSAWRRGQGGSACQAFEQRALFLN